MEMLLMMMLLIRVLLLLLLLVLVLVLLSPAVDAVTAVGAAAVDAAIDIDAVD